MSPDCSEASSGNCAISTAAGELSGEQPVRLGTLADIDDLQAIESRAFSCDRISRRSFSKFLLSPRAILVVQAQASRCIGYGLLIFHPAGRIARLYSLAVDPFVRGRGIGSRLLSAAERTARLCHAEVLRLEVSDQNPSAHQFYLKSGFEVFGRYQRYYADGSNALRMQKAV